MTDDVSCGSRPRTLLAVRAPLSSTLPLAPRPIGSRWTDGWMGGGVAGVGLLLFARGDCEGAAASQIERDGWMDGRRGNLWKPNG